MAYYLQKIKLGVTCREIADTLWSNTDPRLVDYSYIRALDDKFQTQQQAMPHFLRCDLPASELRAVYGTKYNSQVHTQAVTINLMLNTRRCKLHLPFLTHAKSDPRYSFSRLTALQSARAVFDLRRFVLEAKSSFAGNIVQYIFYATIVLVIDLCLNREDSNRDQLIAVREAIRITEETTAALSPQGKRSYDSLVQILHKHGLKSHIVRPRSSEAGAKDMRMSIDSIVLSLIDAQGSSDPRPPHRPASTPDTLTLDQLVHIHWATANSTHPGVWQGVIHRGPQFSAQQWEALVNDLDMRVL